MTPNDEQGRFISTTQQEMASIATSAAIGAALMLYVGFGMNLKGVSGSALYDGSVAAFTLTMKFGGMAMAVMALLLYLAWRPVLIADALLTALVGVVLIGTGVIWMMNQDMQGILNAIFGVLFLGSAKRSWMLHCGSQRIAHSASAAQAGEIPVASAPLDAQARQAAMDRLMATKRREAEVKPEQPPAVIATLTTKTKEETKKDEPPPPPGGFLAQLGRDDQ